jgi:hypothetical protein
MERIGDDIIFRKSSFCGFDNYCVGVNISKDNVFITNTNDPECVIKFSIAEWISFINGVKNNEFEV